jgi:hypothetical protein
MLCPYPGPFGGWIRLLAPVVTFADDSLDRYKVCHGDAVGWCTGYIEKLNGILRPLNYPILFRATSRSASFSPLSLQKMIQELKELDIFIL